MTKKKVYDAPVVKSEPIRIGVFGNYGGGPGIDLKPWKRRRRRRTW
jgi:hypothetical protein